MSFKYDIGKVFGYIEREYSLGVKSYFGPRIANRPHETLNYRPEII